MTKRGITSGLAIVFLLGFTAAGFAQEGKEEIKEILTTKTVSGEVSGVSSDFIAISYGMSKKNDASLEMALTVDKNVKVEHKDNLSQIGPGDTVSVTYEEKTQKDEKGNIRVKSRVAKKITFLKAAKKIEETGALKSQEE